MRIISLIILIQILLVSSCITEKKRREICSTCPVATEVVTKIKDSIHVKEVVTHDTIYRSVLGPTVVIPGPCDKFCDKNGKLKSFYSESKHNGLTSILKTDTVKNTITATCKEDSLMQVNEKKTILINELKDKVTEISKTVKVKDTELTGFQRFCRWWFFITIALIVGFLSPKLLKLFKVLP